MTSEDLDPCNTYAGLLNEGVPSWHVADQLRKHIKALRGLPDTTEKKQETLKILQGFLDGIVLGMAEDELVAYNAIC